MRTLSTTLRTRRTGFTRRAASVLALSLVTLAACEGDNLFENGGTRDVGGPPVVTSVTAAATARENSRVDVRVKAVGRRGITEVEVRFRGAFTDDQVVNIDPASSDTVTVDVSIDLPEVVTDSVLRIEVSATDQFGGVSEIVSRTVTIIDASAPIVSGTLESPTASAGGVIQLRLTANDELGLRQVGYAVVSANGDTLGGAPTLIDATGIARDTTFSIQLPETFPPSEIKVVAIAVNASNMRGVSAPLAVTVVDALKPVVTIVSPGEGDSYTPRDSLAVRVRVADASGITSVKLRGISFRNFPDSTQNTTPVVRYVEQTIPFPQGPDRPLPTDTTITRFLRSTADSIPEPVFIIAEATDAQGNSSVDTVRVVAGPRVVIVTPVTGTTVLVNSDLIVRITGIDATSGLDSIKVVTGGTQTDTITYRNLSGTTEQVDRTTTIRIGGGQGNITLRAIGYNRDGVTGSSGVVNVTATTQLNNDAVPPRVQRTLSVAGGAARAEYDDSIFVRVAATDGVGSGIVRMGAVVIAIPANEGAIARRDTFYMTSRTYAPLSGTPDTTLVFRFADQYNEVTAAGRPLSFSLVTYAYAIDAQGNCGASVSETLQSLPCQSIPGGTGNASIAANTTGTPYQVTAVAGSSVGLPQGTVIADAVPDANADRVYLSNFGLNRVDVIRIGQRARGDSILVGSEPWGMFLAPPGPGRADSTLIVANSGGTNLSFIPTGASAGARQYREDPAQRLLTPDQRLFEVTEADVDGFLRYTAVQFDFSDRPQFIAEDVNGLILYSTKPTSTATPGTLRTVIPAAVTGGAVAEPKILLNDDAFDPAEDRWAISNIDRIVIVANAAGDNGADDEVIIYDHVPGRPGQTIFAQGPLGVALFDALRAQGSDVQGQRAAFNIAAFALQDTTYVAASGDRRRIVFGEGDRAPFGRLFLWDASPLPAFPDSGSINSQGTLDLVSNAAERVLGVALNSTGEMGVGRGVNSSYFFSNNTQGEGFLRLQGVYSNGISGGNGGVALHPRHAGIGPDANNVAFIATGNRSIKIVDTYNFAQKGEIAIRDNVVGQLRAAIPNPLENAGVGPGSCDFVEVQLYGVTATNSLLIVNVRRRDFIPGCQ